MWMAGLTLPFNSLTFLLLALTSPGTWGVALFFWLSDWINSPSVPLLHSTYLFPSPCLVYCAPRPFSVLQLAQQVSGIVMWNPVKQKLSKRKAHVLKRVLKWLHWTCWNMIEQKVMGKIRVSQVNLEIILSCEGKKETAGTCSKPCTTTLKCLQPSLHEGCQGLHSNTDQGTSLLSIWGSCGIMQRKFESEKEKSNFKGRTGP